MMDVFDLLEKVRKAEEAVEKTEKTIERHEKAAAKKLQVIREHGWDENDPYCRLDTPEHHDCYWAVCEYRDKLGDAEGARKKLADKKRVLENWKARLEEAKKRERIFLFEVPDCMKAMQDELVVDWDEFDKSRREQLRQEYQELGYKAFTAKRTHADYEHMYKTEEEIHKANVDAAQALVMDLYVRVSAITGEVTDWSGIRYGGKALNGIVEGKLGKVRVESILAGGWNIQRRHVRVLVHEMERNTAEKKERVEHER